MEKRALGKGLSALIPENITEHTNVLAENSGERIMSVSIEKVIPSKYQPREKFDSEKLDELKRSIKEKGVVQPLIVRESPNGNYELIAGERRLRAMKALDYKEVSVIVRNVNDLDVLELSLIENIQRENLNSIEEAHAYKRLMDEFNFTQEKISEVIGKERSTVANTLRLLSLPKKIQELIQKGDLSIGHAKVILSVQNERKQLLIAEKIITKGLSVRELEVLVMSETRTNPKKEITKDEFVKSIEEELQMILGTKIRINHGKKRGTINIEYFSNEDLDRILKILRRQ